MKKNSSKYSHKLIATSLFLLLLFVLTEKQAQILPKTHQSSYHD